MRCHSNTREAIHVKPSTRLLLETPCCGYINGTLGFSPKRNDEPPEADLYLPYVAYHTSVVPLKVRISAGSTNTAASICRRPIADPGSSPDTPRQTAHPRAHC